MIFVSYAHADKKWRERFRTVSRPLSKVIPIEFWSDEKIRAGEWDKQIKAAMKKAEAVVFMVSCAFLASDYIMNVEVPFFLRAHRERNLMIFWALLDPCDLSHQPGKRIKDFTAMTLDGNLKDMSSMTDWQWKATMVNGCQMIDNDFVKPLEKPVIDASAKGKPRLPRIARNFLLLKHPARRNVAVLVQSGRWWWRQGPVKAGERATTIYVGDDKTKSGEKFKLVALTTDTPLTKQKYLNLPDYRTKSEEFIVTRA
jgi:hypothetical protein